MQKFASAHWEGDIKGGHGSITTESGVIEGQSYGFNTRFGGERGTNPEELIGAAHASCFSMALSKELGDAGITPESIDTKATVALEEADGGFAITAVHLDLRAKAPGADKAAFEKAANAAKDGCPVSKLLNADITLEAQLQS